MKVRFCRCYPDGFNMSYVVVGGGISGLATAHYLSKLPKVQRIQVLEATDRLGGWIQTTNLKNGGGRHEHGPRTVRPTGPAGENTLELVTELGIQDDIVPIPRNHPTATNRMVLVGGQLHKLPSSFLSLFKIQKPFTKPLALAAWHDLTAKVKKCEDDSIYDFVSRRLGPELAQYAIDPMVRGICAGDARNISAASFVTGSLFQMEQEHGGIFKGVLKNTRKKDNWIGSKKEADIELVDRSKAEKWAVWSLKDGLESLVSRLSEKLETKGIEIIRNVKDIWVEQRSGVLQSTSHGGFTADHIFLSTPAYASSKMLQKVAPEACDNLSSIPFVTVAVVTIEFNRKVTDANAFGFLVPSNQPEPILGTIFDTCSFPQVR